MVDKVIHIYFNYLLVIDHRALVIASKHMFPLIPYFIDVVVEYVMARVEVDGSESWSWENNKHGGMSPARMTEEEPRDGRFILFFDGLQ
jgi:hypothetical protein